MPFINNNFASDRRLAPAASAIETSMMVPFTLFVGCAAPKADPGIDVSGLLCAGTEDPDGNVLVPTVSTDGCDGGAVSGRFAVENCPACTWESGYVALQAYYEESSWVECSRVDLDSSGTFEFGPSAPADYAVSVHGTLATGEVLSSKARFELCSEDVEIEDAAYRGDTDY